MPPKVDPELKAFNKKMAAATNEGNLKYDPLVEKMRKAEAAYKKTKEYKLWLEKLEYSKNNV